jgi:anti-anti-sigma factor
MATRISMSREGAVAVFSLQGPLDGGPECRELQDLVKRELEGGAAGVVIDLADADWMNSIGEGHLVACYVSCKRAERPLVLAAVKGRLRRLLETTRLLPDVFDEAPDRATAVRSLKR